MYFNYWSRPKPCEACYKPTRGTAWLLGKDNPPVCKWCWEEYDLRPKEYRDVHDPYKSGYAWWKQHKAKMLQDEDVVVRKALLMLEGRTYWPARYEEGWVDIEGEQR